MIFGSLDARASLTTRVTAVALDDADRGGVPILNDRPPLPYRFRRSGRVVECTGLENRRARKGAVGSNPTSSAF